jgi:hypothetical protein
VAKCRPWTAWKIRSWSAEIFAENLEQEARNFPLGNRAAATSREICMRNESKFHGNPCGRENSVNRIFSNAPILKFLLTRELKFLGEKI